MNIKNIATEELVKELENRENVQKIAVGPYQSYRLETKYERNGSRQISSDMVLIVNGSVSH